MQSRYGCDTIGHTKLIRQKLSPIGLLVAVDFLT